MHPSVHCGCVRAVRCIRDRSGDSFEIPGRICISVIRVRFVRKAWLGLGKFAAGTSGRGVGGADAVGVVVVGRGAKEEESICRRRKE